MPMPEDFEAESLYTRDAWFVHDVLELDREAGRVVGLVDTTRLGAFRETQRPLPGHTPHVPGAVIHEARFTGMGQIGPSLRVTLQATRVRHIGSAHFVTYDFRFEQDGRKIFTSTQTAAWTRPGG